jgi:tetratricopeptide (TPR) repeat protein
VLVDTDGRVRVMDFGLARSSGASSTSARSGSPSSGSSPNTDGLLLGTPRYMAPEQHEGAPVDALADQYAFCVALFEALYGAPPFSASTLADLHQLKRAGKIAVPSSSAGQPPRRLLRVLTRGLAPRAIDRHATMGDLLAALQHVVRPRRSGRAFVALTGLTAATATAVLLLPDPPTPCRDAGTQLAGVWNDAARSRTRAAVQATGAPGAHYTAARLDATLQSFAEQWIDEHRRACEDTNVRHEQPDAVLDRRMACLTRQRDSLAATVSTLADVDAKAIEHAIHAVDALPAPARCTDADDSEPTPVPTDAAGAREVAEIRRRVDEVDALTRIARFPEARQAAAGVVESARASGFAPVIAEALAAEGRVLERISEFEAARSVLTEAFHTAQGAGYERAQFEIASLLAYLVGYRLQDPSGGQQWLREAEAVHARGGDDPERAADLESTRGLMATVAGERERSAEHFASLLALLEARPEVRPLQIASAHSRLGAALWALERFDDAEPHLRRALAIEEEELGPEHPRVATDLTNLAGMFVSQSRFAEALPLLERALPIVETGRGKDDVTVGIVLNHLGSALSGVGKHREAADTFARASAILDARLGERHPHAVAIHNNWGAALQRAGDSEGGLAQYRRALELAEQIQPEDHPDLGDYAANVAMTLSDLGRFAEALPLHERALAAFETLYGTESPSYALQLGHVGEALHETGRTREALQHFERAAAIALPEHVPAHDVATLRFRHARALWSDGGDPTRAVALAASARDVLDDPAHATQRRAIEHWLADRP